MENLQEPGILADVGVVVKALAVFGLSITIAYLIRLAIEKRIMRNIPRQVAVPLVRAIYYSIVFVGAVAALSISGVNLSSVLVAGGIVGIIIGFASQTVISNFLSGMFLYIDRPFAVGDPIIIGEVEGIVENITVFSTRVRQWNGVMARIPNENVFRSLIMNPYQNPIRRFEHVVVIAHDEDIDRAIAAAMSVMEEDSMVLVRPGPEVLVSSIDREGVVLSIRGWAPSQYWFSTKNRVLYGIKRKFEKEGIRFAVPPRDVWIRGFSHPSAGS